MTPSARISLIRVIESVPTEQLFLLKLELPALIEQAKREVEFERAARRAKELLKQADGFIRRK